MARVEKAPGRVLTTRQVMGLAMRCPGGESLEYLLEQHSRDVAVSPLGRIVGDALGFAFDGLMRIAAEIQRAAWSSNAEIVVRLRRDLEPDELTRLWVASADLGLRLGIGTHSRTQLALIFAWGDGRPLDAAIQDVREHYDVVQDRESA